MTIIRYYKLDASDGREGDLVRALQTIALEIARLGNRVPATILVDPDSRGTIVFMEYWRSIEEHRAMGALLGKNLFRDVIALLRQPPESRYLVPADDDRPTV